MFPLLLGLPPSLGEGQNFFKNRILGFEDEFGRFEQGVGDKGVEEETEGRRSEEDSGESGQSGSADYVPTQMACQASL